jgi:hypothetical protein
MIETLINGDDENVFRYDNHLFCKTGALYNRKGKMRSLK